jgi:Ser/Thr protein kinase RdoA (MazF antagonist)
MLTPSFVANAARELYGLEPLSIESLDQHQFELRGIYRIRDAQGGVWVMRLKQGSEELEALAQTARALDWLAGCQYAAPSARTTIDQQLVGTIGDWAISVISYVEGSVLGMTSADDFKAFAQAVGRLHSLRVGNPSGFAPSRCHPDTIAIAAQQLASHHTNLPVVFQDLADNLHASMRALQRIGPLLAITHGDCWYQNAVKTGPDQVTLIDWDNVGIGWPLLEIGNLLLTAHFDLSRPLMLQPSAANTEAILRGYQQQCRIPTGERAHLADAMRFLLAFQLGSYITDASLFKHPDFPFVLEKLQARYNATQPIADIAAQYFESERG